MMKKFLQMVLGLFCLLTAIGCFAAQTNNNANGNTLTPQLKDFDALNVAGAFVVHVTAGKPQSVVITGDPQLLAQLTTEVNNNTLYISYSKKFSSQISKMPVVTITVPQLKALMADGNNKVEISQLKNTDFSLSTHGAQKIKLSGAINAFNIMTDGATQLDAKDLIAQKATVTAHGDAKITLNVTEELHISTMGNTLVKVYGHPKSITTSMYGNGRVEAMTD